MQSRRHHPRTAIVVAAGLALLGACTAPNPDHSAARPVGSSTGLRVSGVATRQVWTHVAMTYDGSTVRLSRNGVELGREDIGRPLVPSSKPFYIGLNENGSSVQSFEGQLDDVVIYNRPLPATAIMALADGASPTGF